MVRLSADVLSGAGISYQGGIGSCDSDSGTGFSGGVAGLLLSVEAMARDALSVLWGLGGERGAIMQSGRRSQRPATVFTKAVCSYVDEF